MKQYEQCQIDNSNVTLCSMYTKPIKQRDTISTFGYITLTDSKNFFLQTLAPLLIMIVAVSDFHKKLKNGYLNNSITRIGYKKGFSKLYLNSLKNSFILPVFFIILFICSYFISGNFDYKYGSSFYGFDAFGVQNCKNWLLFIIIYLTNFILHSIFWININIYNCKHNKNFLVCTIFSYIEYLLLFVICDLLFAGTIFANTNIAGYFSFTNIWSFSELNVIGVLISSFILALISTIIILISYKDKEKVLGDN